MQDQNGDAGYEIIKEGVVANGYLPELRNRESAQAELISYLAQTVLEQLEEMERETALQNIKDLPPERLNPETRSLTKEIAGLKARLRWIAQGM
jgi:hypothetical protein